MKKRIVAIDVDDVIADASGGFISSVNKHLDINLTKEDYKIENEYWNYYEKVWEKHGIRDRVSFDVLDKQMIKDQSHIELLPGASFAIGELSKRFDIAIITARNLTWKATTLKWLKNHFGDVFTGVHFVGNKFKGMHTTKGVQARELGAEWLIDDSPEHCQSALNEGVQPILFGKYGWHIDVPEDIIRCKDWPAVLEYFDGIS